MINAEYAVIGTLINHPEKVAEADEVINVGMIEHPLLRENYKILLSAYENNQTIGYPVIIESLKATFTAEDIDKVYRICLNEENLNEFKENLQVVKRCWQVRKVGALINRYKDPNYNTITEDIADIINELEEVTGQDSRSTMKPLSEIAKERKGNYFKPKTEPQLHLPFKELDDMIKGLEGGDLIVLGARPGVGKSAFVSQLSLNFVKDAKRIGFYSLEMKHKQLYERFAAIASGLTMDKIRTADHFENEEEKALFDDGNSFLEQKTTLFISEGARTVSQIRKESQHMEYDLIIIDYLQLLIPEGYYGNNRYAEVGKISHDLKAMAMDFDIPVIALSQLNRVSANNKGKELKAPTMSEMRESGDIEQDASIIILLWNKTEDGTVKGVKVPKNRQGKFGELELKYNGALMSFTDSNGYTPTGDDGFTRNDDIEQMPWD